MKKILIAVNSSISVPSGIMTFVQNVSNVLRANGHTVDGISDGPSAGYDMDLCFDEFYYDKSPRDYKDINHQVVPIPEMEQRIKNVYNTMDEYDIIISNDCQSTMALAYTNKVLHYVHIGAIIDNNCIQTVLSKEYLDYEIQAMHKAKDVGIPSLLTATLINCILPFKVLGLPLTEYNLFLPNNKKEGVLFIGAETAQKGADVFIDKYKNTDVMCKIISNGQFNQLNNKIIKQFGPTEIKQKAEFIKSAEYMVCPSRSETFSYSCMEALLSQNVYVDTHFDWTANIIALGAKSMEDVSDTHNNSKVIDYLQRAEQQWIKYCK